MPPRLASATTDYNTKLAAYNQATNDFNVAKNAYDAAVQALNTIQNSSAANRTRVYQLYALIFNQTNPDTTGVSWWINDLNTGKTPANVAWNMYQGMTVKPASNFAFMQSIYSASLGRTDNDTTGMTYWANQFGAAADGDAKGQVLVNMIDNILSFTAPDLATATANESTASRS